MGAFLFVVFVVLVLPIVSLMPVRSCDSILITSFNIKRTPAASIELVVAGIPVKCIRHVRGVKSLLYPVCLVESTYTCSKLSLFIYYYELLLYRYSGTVAVTTV